MPWMATSPPGRAPACCSALNVGHDVFGVAAVQGGPGLVLVRAVDEVAAAAEVALAAVAGQVAESDAFAGLPGRHALADRVDDADDLVSRHDRRRGIAQQALGREEVGMAHAAAQDLDADLAGAGRGLLAVDKLELPRSGYLVGAVRRHGSPQGSGGSRASKRGRPRLASNMTGRLDGVNLEPACGAAAGAEFDQIQLTGHIECRGDTHGAAQPARGHRRGCP